MVDTCRLSRLASGTRRIFAITLCAFASAALFAQSGETDAGEVAAFGGGIFGLGSHPVVGGSSGFAFSRYGMAVLEAAYMPLGQDTLRSRRPMDPATQDSSLYDFNLSLHIRVPVRERWAPYAILGGGLLFDTFNAVSGPQGALVRIHEFNFGFHTGAGLRYHIRDNWGIRPELKVIVSNRTYTRLSVGIFYTLPPGWP
jgi:opacity protein-like surface antigen